MTVSFVVAGSSGGAGTSSSWQLGADPLRFGCSLWPATRNDTATTLKQRGGIEPRKRGKGAWTRPPRPRCLSVGVSC